MILSNDQMEQILEQLVQRTEKTPLGWNRENDHLWVELPNQTKVELDPADEASQLTIKLTGPTGQVYGQLKSVRNPESPATRLYKVASEQAAHSFFSEIMDVLKLDESLAVELKGPRPRVTPEQISTVLQKMSGRWSLDFSRGKELVTISEDGEYFVKDPNKPHYKLTVLAWNESTSTTEVAKDTNDGRRFQIELLTISTDSMIGHAKHDGHKLFYKRLKE